MHQLHTSMSSCHNLSHLDNKAHEHTIHIYLHFTRKSKRWKSKDVEIVGVEISLTNFVQVLSRHLYLGPP